MSTSVSARSFEIASGPFDPTLESLRSFRCPEWFRDAKLGFWSHWGPQSVPMFGDWYARNLYIPGHAQYLHHWRVYGHPSRVGWKDIIPTWKAEKFDPAGLMELFVAAGGKYFVAQGMHHDNFDNFDSAHNRWNSVNMGPHKDIVGLWKQASQAHGLPFGVTEHLGASFNWWGQNKEADASGPYAGVSYDGVDPEFRDLYHDNKGCSIDNNQWYTDNEKFHQHWFHRIKDLIDKYHPDLLYSDGALPFGEYGRRIVAHLYNTSVADHGRNHAVYNQKDTSPDVYRVGVLDIERGQMDEIAEDPWQTDTSVGDWFYNVKDVYKTPEHVLESLVDMTSKNGNLLLNIPQRPDGTLDDECTYLLKQMAAWVKINGAGIFGTRPWRIGGEGPSTSPKGAFNEDAVSWGEEDFRFAQKENTLYVFQMRFPKSGQALVRSLATGAAPRVGRAVLLGAGELKIQQQAEGLQIALPETKLPSGPHCFQVIWE